MRAVYFRRFNNAITLIKNGAFVNIRDNVAFSLLKILHFLWEYSS